MKTKILIIPAIAVLLNIGACKKSFLDVVPDNLATIDNAFTRRSEAIKYLATCYAYLPNDGTPVANVAYMGGDEFWLDFPALSIDATNWNIARGGQNVVNPYVNQWEWMPRAIRDCNIFLENLNNPEKVRDISSEERKNWIGEVEFLKAYYHFVLFRQYGPIPIMDKNLPVSTPIEEAKLKRETVDRSVDYIVQLLDQAAEKLPSAVMIPVTDMGRITKPIALSMKAKVLLYAASPLFNGNTDYSDFRNKDGEILFNQQTSIEKWDRAAKAAKEAILECEKVGIDHLYKFPGAVMPLSDTTMIQMSIRNAVTEKWNSEIIWGNPNSRTWQLQYSSMAHINPNFSGNNSVHGTLAPPLKIVEQFYTKNGVPIEEDKDLNFSDKSELRRATRDERFNIKENYQTARLNFDRENRFYADLGFDGGVWYMEDSPSRSDENTWTAELKLGQAGSGIAVSATTYYPKKLVNWKFAFQANNQSHIEEYPFPVIRLADLYLMYAEALNEAETAPSAEVYKYLDLVRERAGLKGVVESWRDHTLNQNKPATKEGLRNIIRRERNIEMAFEGSRFWDLRRWKTAAEELNKNITGWDRNQESADLFYRQITLYTQRFIAPRDYLWPIREGNLVNNQKLVQNPGW